MTRHLLKPIQKNKMTVISGILQAAKITIKIAPIAFRAGKIGYQAAGKTKHGAQWIRKHPKIIKYGTIGAAGASLLLDLTNIDYSAIPSPTKYPSKNGQTRANLYSARSGQQYYSKYQYLHRRRCRCKSRSY